MDSELARKLKMTLSRFYEELTRCCGYMLLETISHVEHMLTTGEDQEWGISSMRPRILSRLHAFVDVVDEFGHLPAMRDIADEVRKRLNEE